MKAIVLAGPDGPAAFRCLDFENPGLVAGHVLVRLHAAAFNHRDVWIAKGQYAGLRFPIVPGSDGAGEVIAVGDGVDESFIGWRAVIDPAMGWGPDPLAQGANFRILGLPDHGTFAQYVVVPVRNIHAMPSGLTFEEAAAIPLAGVTGFRALVTQGRVQPGETVLVTGVGGGVATMVVQMARYAGARVFVTSSSEEKLARARDLGAEGGANYRDPAWVEQIRDQTDGGPHLIIDGAGGPSFDQLLDVARPGGRLVVYGATTGAVPNFQLRRLFWKQLTLQGSTMGTGQEFAEMLKWFENGALSPVLDRVYPLAEAAAAATRMDEAGQFGKIVLSIPA